jgi:hypothetical protein
MVGDASGFQGTFNSVHEEMDQSWRQIDVLQGVDRLLHEPFWGSPIRNIIQIETMQLFVLPVSDDQ